MFNSQLTNFSKGSDQNSTVTVKNCIKALSESSTYILNFNPRTTIFLYRWQTSRVSLILMFLIIRGILLIVNHDTGYRLSISWNCQDSPALLAGSIYIVIIHAVESQNIKKKCTVSVIFRKDFLV